MFHFYPFKKKFIYLFVFLFLVTLIYPTYIPVLSYAETISDTNSIDNKTYVEGEALVLLSDESLPTGSISSNKIQKSMSLPKDVKVEQITQIEGIGDTLTSTEDTIETKASDCIAQVSSDTLSTTQLIASLQKNDDVVACEPNYIYHINSYNDPYYNYQWGVNPSSSISSSQQSDIGLTNISSNVASNNVVVVMDTGINYNHEDLTGRVLTGYNYNAFTNASGGLDDNGHGTHCAGTIAANANNGKGITGITSLTSLISVKTMDSDGYGSSSELLAGLKYVQNLVRSGVAIKAINMSFGGFGYSSYILSAINTLGESGVISIAAAGNDGKDITYDTSYPASYDSPYLISVAASTPTKELAAFSDYSLTSVDVAAPGTNILSCSTTGSYNGEITKDDYYENFDALSTSDTFGETLDGSISITTNRNFSTPLSGQTGKSLCWTVNASEGGTYALSLPYTSSSLKSSRYASMYVYIDATTSSQDEDTAAICAYDASNASLPTEYFDGMYLCDTNYWNLINGQIKALPASSSVVLKLANTHAGTYQIYIDSFATGNKTISYNEDYGTSMAAPFVTAEAALLSSIFPYETAAMIVGRIKGGVDSIPSMKNKISSGGIVNFAKATYIPGPSISEASMSEKNLVIKGTNFNEKTASNILVNNELLPVISWTLDTIILDGSSLTKEDITVVITTPYGSYTYIATITPYAFVTMIALDKETSVMNPKSTLALSATIYPKNAVDNSVTWSSSNTKYATVSDKGVVTAKSEGKGKTVTITAKANDRGTITASCTISINRLISKLKLNKTSLSIKAGKKVKLKVTITPKKATNKKVSWKTSNKKYATVSKKGVVKTKKAGKGKTVTITVKAKDKSKKKAICKIKIK